jgi:hypothetical protein
MTDTTPAWIAAIAASTDPAHYSHPSGGVPPAVDDGIAQYRLDHPDAYRTGPGEPAGPGGPIQSTEVPTWPPHQGPAEPWPDKVWSNALPPGTGAGPPAAQVAFEREVAERRKAAKRWRAGPVATQIILVPIGASTDYGRRTYPAKYPRQPQRECWRPQTGIPDRAAHREAVRQLLGQTRDQREALIDRAKAVLAAA